MIYHLDKNYLFVHIQKTGGTSISEALVKHAGASFISPPHLQLKSLNFSCKHPFVFAVVRNPWDRLVSWYEMMKRKGVHNDFSKYLLASDSSKDTISFSNFIRRTAIVKELNASEVFTSKVDGLMTQGSVDYFKSLSFNQLDYLTDKAGNQSFDAIIRFENLADDFCKVLAPFHHNIHANWLSRLNVNSSHKNYREYYQNSDDLKWVSTLYEKDIDYFKFIF